MTRWAQIAGLTIGAACSLESQSVNQKTLTVCDIFQELNRYSGQMVEVRGELWTGQHGWALSQKGCPKTYTSWNKQWPTSIDLVRAGSGLAQPPAAFSLDSEAVRKADKLLCFLHESTAAELGVEITATFVGELRVASRLNDNTPPAPKGGAIGYGHMGAYPAQLVYESIKDIVIRQEPQPH